MRRKLKALLLSFVAGALFSSQANAIDLGKIYSDAYKNTTSAKIVEGQERGYVTFGSGYVRFPQSSITPVTIVPPHIRAGCGGIDYSFGALSYLSIDQLVQWLQQVLQAAPAIAFEIALKKMLSGVQSTLNEVTNIAQIVNSMTVESCQASKALVYTVYGGLSSKFAGAEQQAAESGAPQEGVSKDAFSSFSEALKDLSGLLSKWYSTAQGQAFKQYTQDVEGDFLYKQFASKYGNDFDKDSWTKLKFELVASMLGDIVFIKTKTPKDSTDNPYEVIHLQPLLDVKSLMNAASFDKYYTLTTYKDAYGKEFKGLSPNSHSNLVFAISNIFAGANPAVKEKYSQLVSQGYPDGFSTFVAAYLYDILQRIESGQPLTEDEKGFIAATPLPILKWLNTLAYFPGAGETFIDQSKDYIASFYIESMIRDALAGVSPLPSNKVPKEALEYYRDIFSVAAERMRELYEIRQNAKLPIRTFNDFANYVNHFDKAIVTNLASRGIYSSL